MGVSTKVAKRIVQHPDVVRPSRDGATVAVSDRYPEYAVVFDQRCEPPVVITLVFRCTEQYRRCGATYEIVEEAS